MWVKAVPLISKFTCHGAVVIGRWNSLQFMLLISVQSYWYMYMYCQLSAARGADSLQHAPLLLSSSVLSVICCISWSRRYPSHFPSLLQLPLHVHAVCCLAGALPLPWIVRGLRVCESCREVPNEIKHKSKSEIVPKLHPRSRSGAEKCNKISRNNCAVERSGLCVARTSL